MSYDVYCDEQTYELMGRFYVIRDAICHSIGYQALPDESVDRDSLDMINTEAMLRATGVFFTLPFDELVQHAESLLGRPLSRSDIGGLEDAFDGKGRDWL